MYFFSNNTSVRGAALYIDEQYSSYSDYFYYNHTYVVLTKNSVFYSNKADDSIVFVDGHPAKVDIVTSNFTNNIGVCCMLLSTSTINLAGNISFKNNSADSGAAFYLNELSTIAIDDGAVVEFTDNSALSHGGAIFVELSFGCNLNHTVFKFLSDNANVSFIDTADGSYGDNTVYFSVSTYCNINLNYSESNFIMYVPYQFNYSQFINCTLIHIPANYNYTEYSVNHFPVVTSPHQLKLYGNHVKFVNNVYFIGRKVLNKAVVFDGIILDYFGKPTDTTEFHLKCLDCFHVYTLLMDCSGGWCIWLNVLKLSITIGILVWDNLLLQYAEHTVKQQSLHFHLGYSSHKYFARFCSINSQFSWTSLSSKWH